MRTDDPSPELTPAADGTTAQPTSHPRGLYVLAMAEVWERGSYYAMLALLCLYLTESLGLTEEAAMNLVGTYTGLVYLAALPGGWIADRFLGHIRASFIGGALMVAGHAAMALGTLSSLYWAIGLIAVGNGLFKPSMSSNVRGLYAAGDKRIDNAFSIYYFAVNVGAFISPLIVAAIRHKWGFHAAFGAAGLGLAIGMVQLYFQRHHVDRARNLTVAMVEQTEELPPKESRQRIGAIVLLSSVAIFFFMAFNQSAITLTLWARDCVDRHGIPTETFESVNPLCIMALTVPMTMLLNRFPISTPAKIIVGMLITAAAYGLLALASSLNGTMLANMAWLIGFYFVQTVGELFVSPMGLSMVSKLAPAKHLSSMIGVWYLASAIGNKLAGKLGYLWKLIPHSQFFSLIVCTSLAAALFMWWRSGALQSAIDAAFKQDMGSIVAENASIPVEGMQIAA